MNNRIFKITDHLPDMGKGKKPPSNSPGEGPNIPFKLPALPPSTLPDTPTSSGREHGITTRSVHKAMATILEHNLDLDACIGKGGSLREAALRLREARRVTKLIDTGSNMPREEFITEFSTLLQEWAQNAPKSERDTPRLRLHRD